MSVLERVNAPEDLRRLKIEELSQLAAELRELIIETVAQTGGHLAPNLGVVELTIALHRVFQAPRDKIVWDVGHQCYAHKILTGRRERFKTLRQFGGISGFPCRDESVYDAFGAGHASTSISAALGLAKARDFNQEDYAVVAVIGDGALTGGMALEALNHAGHIKANFIVVLNDNEMSISKNVGALAGYLTRLRTDPMYHRSREEFEALIQKIPAIGPRMLRVLERLKDSVKYLVVPGMFFEELGYTYLGPVDGHSIPALLRTLEKAKGLKGPVLVHVVTRKGKGYPPAEKDPDTFHGVGPFNPLTGEVYGAGKITYTEVFGQTLVRLAEEDPRIVAITAAMTTGTGLKTFARRFPQRFFDVGIAEQHAVTLAAGLAAGGWRPVVAIYSTFLQRAYDQIVHDVCLQCLPVVFALDRAGIVGEDGATHQGLFDIAYLRSIPNMALMAPMDENELQHMLKTALLYGGPCAIRYPRGRGTGCALEKEPRPLPFGQALVLRDGRDVSLFALGNTVAAALEAAERLAAQGIEAAVVNARFVKPLDTSLLLRFARRTRRVVTVEEGVLAGGFGSAVAELLMDNGLGNVELVRLGINDTFVPHGAPALLRERYGLTAENIVAAVTQSRRRLRVAARKK
ncbi:1-deoxy-D-xylulose-5-phosphate synthase [Thermodesulfitimonas autotrophica]|uniref:1-deoxy-D-xylulose-5-phosphate synthase n=1 Tax=Thermodesulfitimonas autotrophica TaxID=1894989 RepID=UPI002FE0B0A8